MKARTDQETWTTGFLIGAHGEIVFGIDKKNPTAALEVRTGDGRTLKARLLGFDRDLGLAVGIAEGLDGVPLRAGAPTDLVRETWLVILGHDKKGRAEPHAGVVAIAPRRSKHGHVRAVVEVPGTPGSPILSAHGELVGIAVSTGRRRTRMVPLSYVAPFLERVVLGGRRP